MDGNSILQDVRIFHPMFCHHTYVKGCQNVELDAKHVGQTLINI